MRKFITLDPPTNLILGYIIKTMASRRRSRSKSRKCRPGYVRVSYVRNGKRVTYCRKKPKTTKRKTSRKRKRTTSRKRKRTTSRKRKRTTSRKRKRSRSRTRTIYVYGAPPPTTTVYYQGPARRSPPRRSPPRRSPPRSSRAPTVTKLGVCNDKGYYSCGYSPMCKWTGTKTGGTCSRK
jgi:hypothetical protein